MSVRKAIVSVFDKTGLDKLAAVFKELNIAVISTGRTYFSRKHTPYTTVRVAKAACSRLSLTMAGGTATALCKFGIAVTDVSEVTDFPEMLGTRA